MSTDNSTAPHGKNQVVNSSKDSEVRFEDGEGYFVQVPTVIIRDSRIPAPVRLLYTILRSYANFETNKNNCFAGQETLAELLNVKVRAVREYLHQLEILNLINIEQRGVKLTNVYLIKRINIASREVDGKEQLYSPMIESHIADLDQYLSDIRNKKNPKANVTGAVVPVKTGAVDRSSIIQTSNIQCDPRVIDIFTEDTEVDPSSPYGEVAELFDTSSFNDASNLPVDAHHVEDKDIRETETEDQSLLVNNITNYSDSGLDTDDPAVAAALDNLRSAVAEYSYEIEVTEANIDSVEAIVTALVDSIAPKHRYKLKPSHIEHMADYLLDVCAVRYDIARAENGLKYRHRTPGKVVEYYRECRRKDHIEQSKQEYEAA